MSSLHNVGVLIVAVALIGAIGATSLQQQASGQGIIVYDKEQFTKLTDEFEKAVSDAAAATPPDPDKIQRLLDDYDKNVRMIFGIEPTIEGDPPTEVNPPDPDAESSDQNLKEPGKLEPPN